MTFEKALEAMKQGKKVRRKSYSAYEYWFYNSDFDRVIVCDGENYRDFGVKPTHDIIESCKDDWEIYEEPKQEKPEMTAGHAIEVLESIRQVTSKSVIPEVDDAIDFAIETIDKLRHQKTEPEKKCECKCKQDIRKLAFDKFTDGMQCAFDIIEETRKDDKEEEKKELGCLFSPVLFFHDKEEEHIDKLEDVFKFMDWLYNSDYEFKPDDAAKIVGCYQGLKDYLYQQRKK